MNVPSVRVAKQDMKSRRQRPYQYKPGKFLLTASFRDDKIDAQTVRMVHALTTDFTQKQIAFMCGISVSVVSKLIRIKEANQ